MYKSSDEYCVLKLKYILKHQLFQIVGKVVEDLCKYIL
jgi:hypothetical protein